jgi:uncharacterized OsmC-like protein
MTYVTAEWTSGLQVDLSNGRHEWRSDEPPQAKGTDTGPNPYELLLGSLAACTCITLSLYATYKGITLRSISASYEFDRVHADDCRECEDDAKGFIDRITSRIRIDGELDEAQKERLAQIAGRCPVHKTLRKGVVFGDNVTFGR